VGAEEVEVGLLRREGGAQPFDRRAERGPQHVLDAHTVGRRREGQAAVDEHQLAEQPGLGGRREQRDERAHAVADQHHIGPGLPGDRADVVGVPLQPVGPGELGGGAAAAQVGRHEGPVRGKLTGDRGPRHRRGRDAVDGDDLVPAAAEGQHRQTVR
jgi:hypothetical protein